MINCFVPGTLGVKLKPHVRLTQDPHHEAVHMEPEDLPRIHTVNMTQGKSDLRE